LRDYCNFGKNFKSIIMKVLDNLKYTEDHEWLKIEGDIAIIGVTDYAQSQLGDVVYVEVETVGEELDKGEALGTIEAVKTVSDIYMPVTGEVLEFNEQIEATPEIINKEPYDNGWIVKIKITNPDELNELLDAEAYKQTIQ
jgi:glycine cleavage system H protein